MNLHPAADLHVVPAWTLAPMAGREAPDAAPTAEAAPALAEPQDELLPRGCGWFDSSFELRQGLHVTEHDGFDRLPCEVPPAWRLQ